MKKYRVAVLCGGKSSEREISLLSGEKAAEALRQQGHEVTIYDPAKDLVKIIEDKEKIDVVFPILHGPFGEDGTIQGFLELIDLPYVGSGVLASALAMDKVKTRDVYAAEGLPIPRGFVVDSRSIRERTVLQGRDGEIGLPCVVKPVANGSSFGVTIVKDEGKLVEAIKEALKYDKRVLVEEYIKGEELTVGVLGNDELKALPVILIKPKVEFFDYQAKYNGETDEIVPAPIPEEIANKVMEYGIRAHKVLGCEGMSRTDMMLRDGKLYLLETNTIPGMTSESLLPKAAKAAGWEFGQLLEYLAVLALEGEDAAEEYAPKERS